ncbi:endolytic transglycosylase MltG [Patescibacteria group bacterium]|nr:endolytic transglycosylase MltG [Patescibacteria group bacterium]
MLAQEIDLNKRKAKSKKMMFGGIILTFVIVILFSVVSYIQYLTAAPNSDNSEAVEFAIESGQGLEVISKNLQEDGLIKNHFVFGLYLKYQGKAGSVLAGEYEITKNLNMIDVANIITKGNIISQKITFPEGWTIDKMGDRLAANNIVSKADFLKAANKSYDYDFLADKPPGSNLEGYLYPDTYEFGKNVTAEEVVKKMLDNFEKKIDGEVAQKIKSSKLSIHEVITLASIVEREVAKPEDRKLVASVFLNRLNINMALESCATIQFITGSNKTQFTYTETRIDNIYNTYINRGLPPGPIGSPSIDSIKAVLDPQKSDYLFFLSADGVTYFSYTLDEHNAKKAKYLN